MQNRSLLRLLRFSLVSALAYAASGNYCAYADKRGGDSKLSGNITSSVSTGQRIDRRSIGGARKIPDNFPLGVVSTIRLEDFALVKSVNVEIHIAHPNIGDLLVQLECPNGRLVSLHNRSGGGQKNLNAAYRVTQCENSQAAGDWKLRISDNAAHAAGSLLSWKLRLTADRTHTPLFRTSGIKDWYLIGNAVTPGNDRLNVRVDMRGTAESIDAAIDGGPSRLLTKTSGGFEGALDISQLPAGVHSLSLAADGSSLPFANLNFRRSHPLYVLMTTDWDSSDSQNSILQLHDKLHTEHPELKITHFFGPYTFTDPDVSPARREFLADWLVRLRTAYRDEIGLHIHPFCNFVNTVPGVTCRFKPSDSYDKGDSTGYTVLCSAYSESEFLKLLKAADMLFTAHGLGKPTAFRAGSWAAGADVLTALAEDGFVADSSANNWARIEESRHDGNGMLYAWNRRHWKPISDISQPYYPQTSNPSIAGKPALPLLEIPDNGSLVDYVTGTEMIDIFNINWSGKPLLHPATFVLGFHPVSYSQGFHRRIEKALAHIDNYLASNGDGPVVYETISRISSAFKDLPKQ